MTYYLRKELTEADGEMYVRTVYKHGRLSRYYRGGFTGLDGKYQGMRVYTCKKLSTILKLRESTYQYCGEYFDVYDENGKVAIKEAA
ncbi:hypothetical protein [Paenibacillus graminis]|uniref:hypothetical protein n=1 Tax=Paenibacillus graminis TaxID=189425 RepID=UPI002DBC5052|nr:hypothetical protein [Paenibacillus graminis]MEC0167883.1 hypothetical protein [Paenibacillus graminis]